MYEELVKKIRHCATDTMHCLSCVEDKDGRCFKRLMTQATDAIEELSKPRWINAEERLPELRQNVLVSDGKGSGEGWLDRYDWHDPNREDVVYTSPQPRDFWCIPGCKVDEDHVTHWMPLPEPPKEEN